MRLHPTVFILAAALNVAAPLASVAHAAPTNASSSDEKLAFFETHIRPTLVAECIECHGAEKQKGGLRLDSRPAWQKGGDSGATIVPGEPDKSLLLRTIRHLEPDLKMPDKAPKLDDAIIAQFERWIAMGAPDPRDTPPSTAQKDSTGKASWPDLLAARRSWWSFLPIGSPRPPSPQNADASAHPVDLFLNAAIERAGLQAAPPASAEVLVRRLHFILTGLPPAPREVRSFESAYALDRKRAVRERAHALLASPAFGEHWARHWMDLVRYADSHGSEGDPEIPGAFRYRDYLIRAFNADVPLDQLMREHLCGDLLSNPRISPEGLNESRIGPAHLRMVEHGYQPVDSLDDQIKAVDNQIDVVTKAFQGLTVSCARCHDHKFDPISQMDYTALYGIFASVRPTQLVVDSEAALGRASLDSLRALKSKLRAEFADHWLSQLGGFSESLALKINPPAAPQLASLQAELAELNAKLARLEWSRLTPTDSARTNPVPYAIWSFQRGENELFGKVGSELVGGATIKNGCLELNGSSAYLKTAPLPQPLGERSYETWVSPTTLEQSGGGVIGVEQVSNHAFDSLVFAEKQKRKWLAGSNNFRRTEQTDGTEEAAAANEFVHLAITYAKDGTISLFRNGKPYGAPFRKDSLHEYPAGDTRVLIGLRHTGAGRGFFAGAIREVRLYDRALGADEVAASFRAGPLATSESGTPSKKEEDETIRTLSGRTSALRARIEQVAPAQPPESARELWKKQEHPLHLALKALTLEARDFAPYAREYRRRMESVIQSAREFNARNFQPAWDLSSSNAQDWFLNGPGVEHVERGDFRVLQEGTLAFENLLPAGIAASTLAPRLGGSAASPDFKLSAPNMSVRFAAEGGALLQVVPDNYPLGANSIFPRAVVSRSDSSWTRLDTSYRMGSNAYVEMSTPDHQARRTAPPKNAPSSARATPAYVIEKVVFHEGVEPPKEEFPVIEWLLANCRSEEPQTFLSELSERVRESLLAWKSNTISEAQRALLAACLQTRLLDTGSEATPEINKLIATYRAETSRLPQPSLAPGVAEHLGSDAPFLPRGDHKKPGQPVPRRYFEVLDPTPFAAKGSGRDLLAERILAAANPLTARVMANRIWHWTFGRGIVPTPDNFGRMGEKPVHPELLDFLAQRLRKDSWSLKSALEFLVTSDAFQRASTHSADADRIDPQNDLLSHASVRRLEAESIRDAMLFVSGALNPKMYGPPVPHHEPRRSIYLLQKRNSLPQLTAVFDAPKPFTTIGRRDVTTVPAQSLTLLNDPAVLHIANVWSGTAMQSATSLEGRIETLFLTGLGRPPSEAELQNCHALLQQNGMPQNLTPIAHALLNLKEFIYLR